MYRLLILLATTLPFIANCQSTLPLRADSIKMEKLGGNAELILRNGTRDSTKGMLVNIGGGRTKFIKPGQKGDTLFVGLDTFVVPKFLAQNFGSYYRVFTPPNKFRTLRSTDPWVQFDTAGTDEIRVLTEPQVGYGLDVDFFNSIFIDTNEIATPYDLSQTTPVLNDTRLGWGGPDNKLNPGTDSLTYDRTDRTVKINKGSSDSAAVTIIQHTYTGEKPFFRIRPPVLGDSTVDFSFTSSLNPNDDDTRSNHVVKMGGNIFNGKPAFPGMWDAWETNWFNGGANYVERHYEVRNPNSMEQTRLFSSTAIIRDSAGNSSNQWDFRGNINLSTFNNLGYAALAPDGLDGVMMQANTPDGTHGIQLHKASGTPNEFYIDKYGSSSASLNYRGWSAYNFGTGSGTSAFANAGTQLGIGTQTPNAGDRLHVYNDAGNANVRIESTPSDNGAQLLFKNDVGLVDLVYAGSTNPFQNLKDHLSVYDGTLGNPIFSINILTGNSVFERRPNLDVIDDPRLLAVLGTLYVGDTMHLHRPIDGAATDSQLVWRSGDSTVRKIENTGWVTYETTTTDNATYGLIIPQTSADSTVYDIEFICVAILDNGDGAYASKKIRSVLHDASGDLHFGTIRSLQPDDYMGTGLSTATATIDDNVFGDIELQYTGETGKNIHWKFQYRRVPKTAPEVLP